MNFVEAIIAKRDARALSRKQIDAFVAGAVDGSLPPEQLAAMLMAICVRGMDEDETRSLTDGMLHSGEMWNLAADVPGVVDKHSTGGVGDTVSLVLAPLLAAVGRPVAMMAGRGLGHSQGTLDKLEAIPGFQSHRNRSETVDIVHRCGAAIIAQSERIAPADRVLYGLRDITGTVPSLPLIVASIMSKKLALGASFLVLDVKWGRGAFRNSVTDAAELAAALRGVARGMDISCEALVTDMNQPLGPAVGTGCEVRAALEVLEGAGSEALRDLTVRLALVAMERGGTDSAEVEDVLMTALRDGTARTAWDSIVEAHGGNPNPDLLPRPASQHTVVAGGSGWLTGVDATALGWVAVDLGAGRRTRDEIIDHGAGLLVHARIGDRIEKNQPLATVLVGERPVDLRAIEERVATAFEIGDEPVDPPRLVLGTIEDI